MIQKNSFVQISLVLRLEITMVNEVTLARTRSVYMIEAGIFIEKVARDIGVSVRTIRRWLLRSKAGESLQNRRGPWKETSVTMVPKWSLPIQSVKI